MEAYIEAKRALAGKAAQDLEKREKAIHTEVGRLFYNAAMAEAKALKLPNPKVTSTPSIHIGNHWGRSRVDSKMECRVRFGRGRGKTTGTIRLDITLPGPTRRRINREIKRCAEDRAVIRRWNPGKTVPQMRRDALRDLFRENPRAAERVVKSVESSFSQLKGK